MTFGSSGFTGSMTFSASGFGITFGASVTGATMTAFGAGASVHADGVLATITAGYTTSAHGETAVSPCWKRALIFVSKPGPPHESPNNGRAMSGEPHGSHDDEPIEASRDLIFVSKPGLSQPSPHGPVSAPVIRAVVNRMEVITVRNLRTARTYAPAQFGPV